ncbi:MAG: MBL fold metallo-hydrolase [Polyangiaceae bacterium]
MAPFAPGSKRFPFVNLDGSEPHPLSSVLKWALVDRVLGRRRSGSVASPAPHVVPDFEALSHPPRVGEPARLTWIGHASWLIQLDGVSLLIDPIFSDSIGPGVQRFVPPAITVSALPRIDAQLVSHNHRDHLDLPSLQAVGSPVIAGLGLSPFFARGGLACTELDWWGEARVAGVTIRFVPSQHWSRRGLNDANATLWGGFVIEGSTARIYHSGDTAYFDGFTEIGRRFGPIDAALLPIGAYDPAWFMSKQHMNPEEAVQAFSDLGARTFVAMHWGTFKLTDEPLNEPPLRLHQEWQRRTLDPAHCHVLPVGGVLRVERPY